MTIKQDLCEQLKKALVLLVALQDDHQSELKEIVRVRTKIRTLELRLEELERLGL